MGQYRYRLTKLVIIIFVPKRTCLNALIFQINFTGIRLKIFLQRDGEALHIHTVSTQSGILHFMVEENLRLSERIIPPNWVQNVLDILHEFMHRRSVSRHSTKC
jgi:hypothetical protein